MPVTNRTVAALPNRLACTTTPLLSMNSAPHIIRSSFRSMTSRITQFSEAYFSSARYPPSAMQNSSDNTITLSASGSHNLPNDVIWCHLRARYPSSMSVKLAVANTISETYRFSGS